MKTIGLIALIVLCAILVSLAWVRFAPAKADRYHVAPGSEPKPEGRGVQLLGEDAPYFEASPSAVEAALRAVAARKGRVKLVAESENPRRMTYLARTKIVGFPDYMTFEFGPEGAGTRLRSYPARASPGTTGTSTPSGSRSGPGKFGKLWGSDEDRHPCPVSRQIGTLSDISHCAMNARPSTKRQTLSPSSTRKPWVSVQ